MKSIKTKKDNFYLNLSFKNEKFKLFTIDINKVNKSPIIKPININIINNRGFNLIIIFMILSVFQLNCRNFFLSKDSIITLRVSGSGEHKIFNNGTKPNEILIDNSHVSISSSYTYDLSSSNIVQLRWTNDISDCKEMFRDCISIAEINITRFDATNCGETSYMFRNCNSLISINLSGFISPNKQNNMVSMFRDCTSLISLNLSSFDTSKTNNFGKMFSNCTSLKWIDISNFKTENVEYMDSLFNGCKSLTSLNLSNFITSKVTNMGNMFKGCELLKIIDFPNLNISGVEDDNDLKNIFSNCNNLEYIDISK